MMWGKEDLGLSLSLSSSENHHHRFPPLQLNLTNSSMAPSPPFLLHQKAPQWHDLLASSDRSSSETRSFLKGIDVNRAPTMEREIEEEAGVSSPNSTISSSLSGKRGERDLQNAEENEIDRACSRGISDEEDGDGSRKKLRLSKDQSAVLEESFKEHNTLNPKQKLALAKQLGLRPRQVEVWFQNRRARTKLKQTEVDCEFLKRCCENMTEENRRLQKEVQELRALKMSPQFYMHMTPPTTLTMCPSCERVATSAVVPSPPDNGKFDHTHTHTNSNGNGNPHYRHRPVSIAPGHGPTVPWAPTPIRPAAAAFTDSPSARS